ncbi:MAG: hypothetical protein ACREXU_02170 [Gammaproteobacteria bacterium]
MTPPSEYHAGTTPWQWHGQHLGEIRPPAAYGSAMSAVATVERSREPVAHTGYMVSALVAMTRFRTKSARTSHVAAILLAFFVQTSATGKVWVDGSRRRIAKTEGWSEWEVRVGLAELARWGWIERRHTPDRLSARYRLTAAFVEAVEAAGEEVSRILHEYIPIHSSPGEFRTHAAPISSDISAPLRDFTRQSLMQRLVKLNGSPKRHGRGYSKAVLRATAVAFHWFIQAALQHDEPVVASLRGLARETGLTFRSAKRARARLIVWGLLAEQDGGFSLDYVRLAQWLFEEGVELPPTPAIQHRRRGRHHDFGRSA